MSSSSSLACISHISDRREEENHYLMCIFSLETWGFPRLFFECGGKSSEFRARISFNVPEQKCIWERRRNRGTLFQFSIFCPAIWVGDGGRSGRGEGEKKKMFPIFRPLLFPRWQSFMEKETNGIRHAKIESRVVKHCISLPSKPKVDCMKPINPMPVSGSPPFLLGLSHLISFAPPLPPGGISNSSPWLLPAGDRLPTWKGEGTGK